MDYIDRKSWTKGYDGKYYSKDNAGGKPRFVVQKTDQIWMATDRITGQKVFEKSFAECRHSAHKMSQNVRQRTPEEYAPGMIAYTGSGQKVQINSFAEDGFRCKFVYLNGTRKGREGYIAEVNWLYM